MATTAKFFNHVDHEILKMCLRRRVKNLKSLKLAKWPKREVDWRVLEILDKTYKF